MLINSAQDFYRVQRACSSIERKYFGQLPVEVPFKVSLKAHLKFEIVLFHICICLLLGEQVNKTVDIWVGIYN